MLMSHAFGSHTLEAVDRFRAAAASLGLVDAETAGRLIAAAADIALVLDRDGMIADLALGSEDLRREGFESWRGKPWREVVTGETRAKVDRLLREASPERASPWREINHPSAHGADVPILYSTMALGEDGPVVALGRDLRGVATLQRKLVDAQAAMEREYARVREVETRYRLLFQLSGEPVLIVDAGTKRIAEANPAAASLLGVAPKEAAGMPLADAFDDSGAGSVADALSSARSTGRAEARGLRLRRDGAEVSASVSLFRQDRTAHYLVRLAQGAVQPAMVAASQAKARLLSVVESMPDALVVCDLSQRILAANTAFLDLIQIPTLEQVRGEALDRWLGRSSVDSNVLVASLKEHGSVRHFGTILRGEYGATEEVEVAAVAVPAGEQPCYGFTIRQVGRRLPAFGESGRVPNSVAHLTELVGRVSMKDLVRETTDLIERMCIEAALEITGDNRASAAEILGLSRQSFYAKMHRFGLGDLGGDKSN